MNLKRYLMCCEAFAPRILDTYEEYHEARRMVATFASATRGEVDDASTAYLSMLNKLIADFVEDRFQRLRSDDKLTDSKIFDTLLQLYPKTPEQLFREAALTATRLTEIRNGDLFDRRELAILHRVFQVPMSLFDLGNVGPRNMKGDKLVVIRKENRRYDVMAVGTVKCRQLPTSWLSIPVHDGEDCLYLSPTDPAFDFFVDDWVRTNQHEIYEDVFVAKVKS